MSKTEDIASLDDQLDVKNKWKYVHDFDLGNWLCISVQFIMWLKEKKQNVLNYIQPINFRRKNILLEEKKSLEI